MIKPRLIIVDTLEELQNLYHYLIDKEYVAFDIETTGLTKRDQIIGYSVCSEEDKAFYIILGSWQNDSIVWNFKILNSVFNPLELLKTKKLIMHNGVFDCAMVDANFKISLIENLHTDTMILAHVLDENRHVGLKALAQSIYGELSVEEQKEMKSSIIANGGIITKDKYELYKADPYLIGKYGAKDAWLTYKLFLDLVSELYEQDLDKFFYEEESMPLLKGPTYEMNTTGLQIDTKRLLTLKKTLEAECLEAKSFILSEIAVKIKDKYPGTTKSTTFNIDSPSQMAWLLFNQYDLEFNTLTKIGKIICKTFNLKLPYTKAEKNKFIHLCMDSIGDIYQSEIKINGKIKKSKKIKEPWSYIETNKAILKKYAAKYKWIEKLLEYKQKSKLLDTYIAGIESGIQYGIIQPSFLQHGTVTGRYSCRNPNFQNLPREDQRIKQCIVARPGKVFVIADYSQLEPRIFSYYSGDTRLMSAFNGKTDFYSIVGIEIFDKHDSLPLKEGHPDAFGVKYKKLRHVSKEIALASAYGATPFQLAPKTGKSINDTSEDMRKYFERFPGVKTMMLEAHKLVKEYGYVKNLFGRIRRLPDACSIVKLYGNIDHAELPYNARKLLNMACNQRIQGTAGGIINRASIDFNKKKKLAGIDARIVMQVHDELIIECNEENANDIALLLQDSMENTNTLPGVKLEAIPRISKDLSKLDK